MAKKMGRPIKHIDDAKLKAICRFKPRMEDVAAFFECSPDHIEKYIKRTYGKTFSEFRDENMVHTRFSLIQKAIDQAMGGNTAMMIFCLKNLCGWMDKMEQVMPDGAKIQISYGKKNEEPKAS